MQRLHLHSGGPVFSRIIAGAWRWHTVPAAAIEGLIDAALATGITTFDHADIYGDHSNEATFGAVLKDRPSLRQGMELVTKCGIRFPSAKRPATWIKHYDTTFGGIVWSVENSLRNFNTDYVDLLLLHRPDPLMDPAEVARAFETLHESGKVRHFGVSNFTSSQFAMLQSYLSRPLVTNQIELSLARPEPLFDGTVDDLMRVRTAPMAWSPLGGGRLLDQSRGSVFEKAARYGCSESQLALAWLLRHPSKIFPVVGTTRPERFAEIAGALKVELDLQDWFQMLAAVRGTEVP